MIYKFPTVLTEEQETRINSSISAANEIIQISYKQYEELYPGEITNYEVILKKKYDNIIDSFICFNPKDSDKMLDIIRIMPKFMKESRDIEERMSEAVDLMTFFCLVDAHDEILKCDVNYIKVIIPLFYNYDIPATNYKKYIKIFTNKNIVSIIKENFRKIKEHMGICSIILEEINFDNNEDKIIDDIVILIDKRKQDLQMMKLGLFQGDYSFQNIYEKVSEQMERFIDFCPGIYGDEYFKTLKEILKFERLSKEDQSEFIDYIKHIEKSSQAFDKTLRYILIGIDLYSPKLQNKIITPDFDSRRK